MAKLGTDQNHVEPIQLQKEDVSSSPDGVVTGSPKGSFVDVVTAAKPSPKSKFRTLRLEQVLEQRPWMIRNITTILTKWSPNLYLSKEKCIKVSVWVKMHKVPVVAFLEDELSLIAT
nr:hypothetical protein [Tanacetum cinerariifolium]